MCSGRPHAHVPNLAHRAVGRNATALAATTTITGLRSFTFNLRHGIDRVVCVPESRMRMYDEIRTTEGAVILFSWSDIFLWYGRGDIRGVGVDSNSSYLSALNSYPQTGLYR